MQYVWLASTVLALMLGALLVLNRRNVAAFQFLAPVLFIMIAGSAYSFLASGNWLAGLTVLNPVFAVAHALLGPLVFAYTVHSLNGASPVRPLWLMVAATGVVVSVAVLVLGGAGARKDLGTLVLYAGIRGLIPLFFAALALREVVLVRLISRHVFSSGSGQPLQWLMVFAAGNVGAWLLVVVLQVAFQLGWSDLAGLETLSSVVGMAFIALMALFGISRTSIFAAVGSYRHDMATVAAPPVPATKPGPPVSLDDWNELKAILDRKRPWLEPELTVQELALQTGMGVRKLSALLHLATGLTFFDYMNLQRIESFEHLVGSGQARNKTILALALESGFNSKTAFNRAYQKHRRQTPSEFVKAAGSGAGAPARG